MIEVPNKIIINDMFTPFTVSLNTHLIDILIKEALRDSPLLIINCGNFLNDDRFNFLIDRINFNPLTDFPINERLYGEALFHIFRQNERYSITYSTIRIIIDLVNILKSSHSNTNRLYHNTTTTQQEHKSVQQKVCFIIYTLNFKNIFLIKYFSQNANGERNLNLKMNLKEALYENFQNNILRHNSFLITQMETTMSKRTSQADIKGKGKALAVQPRIQKPSVKISDMHEGVSIETISL